jgi:biotin operon repressor
MAQRTTAEVWKQVEKCREEGMSLMDIHRGYNIKYVTVHAHFAKMKSKEPIA